MTFRGPLLAATGVTAFAVAIAACVPQGPDLTPPAPPEVIQTPPPATSSNQASIGGTKEEGSAVVLYFVDAIGTETTSQVSAFEGTSWSAGPFTIFAGENHFVVWARDKLDNRSEPQTFTAITDPEPPNQVSIIRTPVDRTSVSSRRPTFRWASPGDRPDGSPAASGIAEFVLTILTYDTTLEPLVRTVPASPGVEQVYVLDTSLSKGWHTVRMHAIDKAQNVGPESTLRRSFYAGSFGDVNGDDRSDVTAGAPGSDDPGVVLPPLDYGRGYLWRGSQPMDLGADIQRDGGTDDRLAEANAILQDIDGTGRAEAAFGVPSLNRAFVHFDGAVGGSVQFNGNGRFGSSFATGDVDGDGIAELFIGAPDCDVAGTPAGCVRMYVGTTAGFASPVNTFHAALNGVGSNADFGTSIAFIGDMDDDGTVEVAVGAPREGSDQGRVYVFSFDGLPLFGSGISAGSAVELAAPIPSTGNRFGASIAGGRDVTGDGLPDLVIGAPDDLAANSGSVYLVQGTSLCTVLADAGATRLGASVALIGAFEPGLQGRSAIAMGRPLAGGGNQGEVVVVAMTGDCEFATSASAIGTAGARLGTSVAPAGDLGNDAHADLIVGSPGANQVTVYLGGTGFNLSRSTPLNPPFNDRGGDAVEAGHAVGGVAP